MLNFDFGFANFLRAYYYRKSAEWVGNQPYRLAGWTASDLAKMPRYYVMNYDQGMAETALSLAPGDDISRKCIWLPDEDLAYYSSEFRRTGLQPALNWYRRARSH